MCQVYYSINSALKIEVIESFEFYTKTHSHDVPKIIEFTNRFHQMCQKYMKECK